MADLDAGSFTSWVEHTMAAQVTGVGVEVPCGDCTACCRSSYFIHVGPDETETLRRIPRQLQFPAPGLPAGHVVLGYDERGRCPMFSDGRCSIYEHRPRTCRTYDCRIFPATGLLPDDDDKALITAQAARWRFELDTVRDRRTHAAVRAAAVFVRDRAASGADGKAPTTSRVAISAVRAHRAFLDPDVVPDDDTVRTTLDD
ncbi:MAG: uncharacterized protein QOI47_1712 [Actinomycetota bacterium]|nr:uncharacterized protein [Actinomycetota bacterium]